MSGKSIGLDEAVKLLTAFMDGERWSEAEALSRKISQALPDWSPVVVARANALEKLGRLDEAVAAYDQAIALNPGAGEPFTRRAVILLRKYWGQPPAPRSNADGERVTYALLGKNGRFGNQLLQYAVTKLYALKVGVEAEFPDWLGRDLFEFNDPFISRSLQPVEDDEADILGTLAGRDAPSLVDRDFRGFFCGNSAAFGNFRQEFVCLFQPGPKLAERTRVWEGKLAGHTVVALHIRRGDYLKPPYWIAPEKWYLDWLGAIWPGLESPCLFVSTDDASVLGAFRKYHPISASDLGEPLPGAEFYGDFYVLTRAHYVAISNSTFSFVASMLNGRSDHFVRPEKLAQKLIPFEPWNAEILLRY